MWALGNQLGQVGTDNSREFPYQPSQEDETYAIRRVPIGFVGVADGGSR